MAVERITASDIAGWDSLDDIASSLEKRGLEAHPEILENPNKLAVEVADGEFIILVEAGTGESATNHKPENQTRHTNLVATSDFETFTFVTRQRDWNAHGRIKYQQFSFEKEQFTRDSGEKNTVLQKLNEFEYGRSAAIFDDLYDTRKVVKEFYRQFESLRSDLVQEVANVPDDRGDAKQRYVQVTLDRMIFLYFIQEKRLLDHNTDYLRENHDDYAEDGDVYDDFYRPLFFDILAEGRKSGEFGDLPHLNGGLFSKNPVEDEFEDIRLGETADETADLFDRVLDFLSDWNWNVDERLDIVDPKNLSPDVLGHIFEQTVNQKEMGAYYTPEEITGFMARRTIHPYLLDQLNEIEGTDYDSIDEVFALEPDDPATGAEPVAADGGAVTMQGDSDSVNSRHVETLFKQAKSARVLDPAVGSGAFLLAVQDVLLDIYMQCIDHFQKMEADDLWELSGDTRDDLDEIAEGKANKTLWAKRQIILNNLYGVDIDDGAVEICKLRLFLSMVSDIEDEPSEVEPLPNIDFNIRQGNSLIGFTDVVEVNQDGDAPLSNFGGGVGDSVKEMFEDVIEAVERHREATSAKEATNARNVAESLIRSHSESLDEKVLDEFHEAGATDVTMDDVEEFHPFHWVIEFAPVYADGGFDMVVGNPPWDQLRASRDNYFSKFDERFRSRMPSDKDSKQEELLADPEIAEGWEEYQQRVEKEMSYFTDGTEYELQTPVIDGRKDPNENNLAGLFLERVFNLVGDDGFIGQVLPGVIFSGSFSKDLRMRMLDDCEITNLVGFENKGTFDGIDDRFQFAVVTIRNGGKTEQLRGIFNQHDVGVLRNLDSVAADIPREVLSQYSLKARIFPNITDRQQVSILESIISHPPLGDHFDDAWNVTPHRELDRARASDRFVESESEGDYPVYGGKNIHQFHHDSSLENGASPPELWSVGEHQPEDSARYRVRERSFNSGNLKKSIYTAFGGPQTSKSQKGFVNDLLQEHRGKDLCMDDVLPDFTEYRIVYRDIARPTDERTMIATVIPKGIVCVHTIQTFSPYELNPVEEDLSEDPLHPVYDRAYGDRELFVITGLLNSIPFDFLMRTKVDSHIVRFKLEESQVPRLTEGDTWFDYISSRAARLNCYGEAFEEIRDRLGGLTPVTDENARREVGAEIDAAAFHAYGLNRQDTQFVLDDFKRVGTPRLMDEAYFEMVSEKYDELEETGPHP